MKKLTIVLFVLFLACGMSVLSFAQTVPQKAAKKTEIKTEVIRGKIVSIDTVKNQVIVKDNKAEEKTVVVDAKSISSLKADEDVKVTLKEGSNTALSIKRVVKKSATLKK